MIQDVTSLLNQIKIDRDIFQKSRLLEYLIKEKNFPSLILPIKSVTNLPISATFYVLKKSPTLSSMAIIPNPSVPAIFIFSLVSMIRNR